jgi:hypothetical protein
MADTTIAATRASDADRDRYADVLREHATRGELSVDQFTHRVDAAYAAPTLTDLDRLVEDLPATRPHDTRTDKRSTLACACVRGIPVDCALITLVIVLIAILG